MRPLIWKVISSLGELNEHHDQATENPMKTKTSLFRSIAAAGALIFGVATQSSFAQTTDPVGFTTLSIAGTGGTQASAVSFLGLSMARPTAFRAVAETVSGTTLTCSAATWTDNQYASTPAPGYFLEVFSGGKAGLMSQIVSCSAADKTLTVADNLTNLGVEGTNVTFKIRPNWSIGTIFGATNNVAVDTTTQQATGLRSGSSTARADSILLYNENTLAYDQYFFYSGNSQWVKAGDPAFADQSTVPIYLHEGVVIVRTIANGLSVSLSGEVKLGQTIMPVTPTASNTAGLNYRGNVYPSGALTLANSGLYTDAAGTTGVKPGSSTARADSVLIWNAVAKSYDQYFYYSGTSTWVIAGDPTFANKGATAIPSGASIIIKRLPNNGSFTWVIPQPFTIQ